MVADRHRLAAYHNKHCWQTFWWYQHRWPWTTLNPQNMGFSEFFAILGCDTHLDWIFAEITGDRPWKLAYEIKLMLLCISWALAYYLVLFNSVTFLVVAGRCSLCLKVVSSLHSWKTKQSGECNRFYHSIINICISWSLQKWQQYCF